MSLLVSGIVFKSYLGMMAFLSFFLTVISYIILLLRSIFFYIFLTCWTSSLFLSFFYKSLSFAIYYLIRVWWRFWYIINSDESSFRSGEILIIGGCCLGLGSLYLGFGICISGKMLVDWFTEVRELLLEDGFTDFFR